MSVWSDPLGTFSNIEESGRTFFERSTDPSSGGRYVIGKVDPAIQKMELANELSSKVGGGDIFSEGFIESYGDVASTAGKAIALYYGGSYLLEGVSAGGAATAVAQYGIPLLGAYANYKGAKEAEKANKAAEEARKKQEAKEQAQYLASKRKQIREARILQARTMQAAANTGTLGSSGLLGSTGASTALFGGGMAFQEGQTLYNQAISQDMQAVADYKSEAAKWGMVESAVSSFGSLFKK